MKYKFQILSEPPTIPGKENLSHFNNITQNQNLLETPQIQARNSQFRENIQENLNIHKLNINRNYRLTSQANFDVWMDYLRTELTSWDLIDLIDPSLKGPQTSEFSEAKRKIFAKDIIINHLNEENHKQVLGLSDPLEILNK